MPVRLRWAALAVALMIGLAGCGGPIDPERPPLYDYEFEPAHEEDDVFTLPSRI